MTPSAKTIYLVLSNGFSARYLLRSGILSSLLTKSDYSITLLTPNATEQYFKSEFESERVQIKDLQEEKYQKFFEDSRIRKFTFWLRKFTLGTTKSTQGINPLQSVQDHFKIETKQMNRLKRAVLWGLVSFLSRIRIARQILLFVDNSLARPKILEATFTASPPIAIINTSLGMGGITDFLVAQEARGHGAKIITTILSWDNPTSKGYRAFTPDLTLAWTELMGEELVNQQDLPSKRVKVTGIAHFDYYHNPVIRTRSNVDEVFKKFQIDPKKRLLYFATKSPVSFPWNGEILTQLAEAHQKGELPQDLQILARIHPITFSSKNGKLRHKLAIEEFQSIQRRFPELRFSFPSILSEKLSFDCTWEDFTDNVTLLTHADLCINILSTMNIESAIAGVPVVNIAFEGSSLRKTSLRQNIQIDLDQIHNQRILSYDAISIAHSPKELIQKIKMNLEMPRSNFKNSLQRLAQAEGGTQDGKSVERWTDTVLATLSH